MGLISASKSFVGSSAKPVAANVALIGCITLAGASAPVPLALSISPGSVSGSTSGSGTVRTNAATVSVGPSSGNLFYSWSAPTGITVDTPNAATTTFSASMSQGQTLAGTASCLVEDITTGLQQTITVNVELDCVSSAPPFSVVVSPGQVGPAGPPNSFHSITLTATVFNGGGNEVYNWSFTSNMACNIVPNGATCQVNYYMGPADTHGYSSTVQLLVQDFDVGGAASAIVTVYQWANGQYGYPNI